VIAGLLADRGIGAFVLSAGHLYDTNRLVAGIVVRSVPGLVVAWVIGLPEKLILVWWRCRCAG